MRLSAHQAQVLVLLLKDSLVKNIIGVWTVDIEERRRLFEEIINQQNREIVDLDKAGDL